MAGPGFENTLVYIIAGRPSSVTTFLDLGYSLNWLSYFVKYRFLPKKPLSS